MLNSNLESYQRVFQLMKSRKINCFIGLVGGCLINASISTVFAFLLKDFVDALVDKQLHMFEQTIRATIILFFIFIVLTPLFNWLYQSNIKLAFAELRIQLFQKICQLPVRYFETISKGDIISRLNNDVQLLEKGYSTYIKTIIFNLLLGIGSLISMFIINWKVAGILAITGVITVIVNLLLSKSLRLESNKVQKNVGELSNVIRDYFKGIYTIKMYREDRLSKQFQSTNNKVKESSIKRGKKNAYLVANNYFLSFMNFGGILAIGALMLFFDSIDLGSLVALIQLQLNLSFVLLQFGNNMTSLQSSMSGADRVFLMLDESIKEQEGQKKTSIESCDILEFRNVTFAYKQGQKLLNNFSMKIEKGQIAVLLGPSGSGKSTIIKLLMGFYPVNAGGIYLNNINLKNMNTLELRKLISYVPQREDLFYGTIEENIKFGKKDVKAEELISAAKAANALDFIEKLPDGFNTYVGQGGVSLSGGQIQRISIARAFLRDTAILLLDEITSALDHKNEELVYQSLQKLMENRITLLVTHQLSSIYDEAIIYSLKEGEIMEQGTYGQLLMDGRSQQEIINI